MDFFGCHMLCMLCAPGVCGGGIGAGHEIEVGGLGDGMEPQKLSYGVVSKLWVGGWTVVMKALSSDLGFVPLDGFCPKQTT